MTEQKHSFDDNAYSALEGSFAMKRGLPAEDEGRHRMPGVLITHRSSIPVRSTTGQACIRREGPCRSRGTGTSFMKKPGFAGRRG